MRWENNKRLSAERNKITSSDVNKTWASSPSQSASVNQVLDSLQSSDMIEREKKRLEVVQRRQQKELEQLLNYEKRRQELKEQAEKKMKEREKRTNRTTGKKAGPILSSVPMFMVVSA